MKKGKDIGKLNPVAEIKDFFAKIQPIEHDEDVELNRYAPLLGRIIQRHRFTEQYFKSAEALAGYIQDHDSSAHVEKRLASVVAANKHQLRRIADETNQPNLIEASTNEVFLNLVKLHLVDPHDIFPEVPEPTNIAVLKNVAEWFEKYGKKSGNRDAKQFQAAVQALQAEWRSQRERIAYRWRAITGRELDMQNFPPPLSELLQYKAPFPKSSVWSYQRYGAEARLMRQLPVEPSGFKEVTPISSTPGAPASDPPAKAPSGKPAAPLSPKSEINDRSDMDNADSEGGTIAEPETNGKFGAAEAAGICDACDPRTLMDLAGRPPLTQPEGEAPRYTFPQELRRGEDIFYDYSVLLPLEHDYVPCFYVQELKGSEREGVFVLAGRGRAIIESLRQVNLAHLLGFYSKGGSTEYVANTIDDFLNQLTGLFAIENAETILAGQKRRAKELAGVIRTAARSQLFLYELGIANPFVLATRLGHALNQFPTNFNTVNRNLPKADSVAPYTRPTLNFPGPPSRTLHDAHFSPSGIPGNWVYEYDSEVDPAQRYLEYLGGDFHTELRAVITAAQELVGVIGPVSAGYEQFRSDFERLATGLVNDAAAALSDVLEEIAELIRRPHLATAPGVKRLALQVIFRQYWFPEGYVQGKLVGYKTLIPNERQTAKRRTFVKTTRETSTALEFSAARQDDFSATQRETSELVKESASAFNFTANTSGHFQFAVWGGDASVGLETGLTQSSKAMHNTLAESIRKSSVSYNEKREVKIRELSEVEDVQEVSSELYNANQEITANYFYYQLLRHYCVVTQLHDLRPVLVRKRELPTPAEVDDHFVSKYIHILLHALPAQLSADAQETVNEIDGLAKSMIRRRAAYSQLAAAFELFTKDENVSGGDPEALARWREQARSKEQRLSEAKEAHIEAEEAYSKARMRMSRVVSHIREHICYYMQFIWQASPRVDHDKLLRTEEFCGQPLPVLTQGLNRIGFIGDEEIFEYTGKSVALLNTLVDALTPGFEVLSDVEADSGNAQLMELLERNYCCGDDPQELLETIRSAAFITDPALEEGVLNARRIQVAQDALVVETMPGQVPLLEGFQMAHRMLDVQRTCLENLHLNERIKDRPWQKEGDDTYAVRRYEGDVPPEREVEETK